MPSFFDGGNAPPFSAPFGQTWVTERLGIWRFRFDIYDIGDRPALDAVTYAFVTEQHLALYIGQAEFLPSRLAGHEKLHEARLSGGSRLLVHRPGHGDLWSYDQVEAILIHTFRPPLNDRLPTLPFAYQAASLNWAV